MENFSELNALGDRLGRPCHDCIEESIDWDEEEPTYAPGGTQNKSNPDDAITQFLQMLYERKAEFIRVVYEVAKASYKKGNSLISFLQLTSRAAW